MAKFPMPKYNKIVEPNSDKQIISVPLKQLDWGNRPVSQIKDQQGPDISHIPNKG
jgi:hypothetical protein